MMRRPTLRSLRWKFDRWVVRHLFPQRAFITFGPSALMTNIDIRRNEFGEVELVLGNNAVLLDVHTYDVQAVAEGTRGSRIIGNKMTSRHPRPSSLVAFPTFPVEAS